VTGELDKDGVKPIDPAKVEQLAAQGLTIKQIAYCLDVGRSTLYERMGGQADVLDAVKRGRAKGIATITNALFQSAKGGNTTSQIFYLKNRQPDLWRDRRELEHSGKGGKAIELAWTVEVVEPDAESTGSE